MKKMFLKISQNSQENNSAGACNFIEKETPEEGFPCDFCEIYKSIYFA